MKQAHNIALTNRSTKLNIKKHKDGDKYYIKLGKKNNEDNCDISEMEIIPTVQNVNRQLGVEIDKRRREESNKVIMKSKLVRKGTEWVVEKVPYRIKELPKIFNNNINNLDKDNEKQDLTSDPYLDKLIELGEIAKREGKEMYFPCDKCSKVCTALCGIKLHRRIHNSKAKPFKPKIWKHKLKTAEPIVTKPVIDDAKPQPIKHKHKCDNELKEFYKNFITGSDIEFGHFLKIYNKMNRDNKNELDSNKDVTVNENVTEQKMNTVKNVNAGVRKKKPRVLNRKSKYIRVIRISKKKHLERIKKINEMRRNIHSRSLF